MKLYIVRHGETVFNKKKIVQGHKDVSLNKVGLEQAKLLAKHLSGIKFDFVYSSDLRRVKKTTEEILKFQSCPIRYSTKLRERNMGIFQGKGVEKYMEYLEKNGLAGNFRHRLLGGGESYNQFRKRVSEFVEKIYLKHKNQTILISTHGGTKRVLLNYLEGKIPSFSRKFKNASLSIVQFHENKKHEIILENFTKHLE
jgi:alpha-ribazole phosphatase